MEITDDMKAMISNVKLGLLRGYLKPNNASDKAIYENVISNMVAKGLEERQADYLQAQLDELMR